jgi:hypothetical protein
MKPGRLPGPVTTLLLALAVHLLLPQLHTLAEMLVNAVRWPQMVADSAVFLQQPQLSQGLVAWQALFLPVNEHRLVFSRLIAALPTLQHQPLGAWSVAGSLLLLALSLMVLDRCLARISVGERPWERWLLLLTGAVLMLNPWQAENLLWDINVHWFLQNLLLLICVWLLLAVPSRIPLWFDLLLPPLALLNGGQGYALLLAVGTVRLALFRRRWLLPLIVVLVLVLMTQLPPGQGQGTAISFSLHFMVRLLQGWWPVAGFWTLAWLPLLGWLLWRQRLSRGWSSWKQLAVASIPMLYSLLFALSATLSRSSLGLAMAQRESYITPLLMLGIGLLLVGWWVSLNRSQLGWTRAQVASLLLPLLVVNPWLQGGFHRPNYFPQQRRLLAEQDRRISWFHCLRAEQGAPPSRCAFSDVYDHWDQIRKARQELPLNVRVEAELTTAEASLLLSSPPRPESRLYLLRNDQGGRRRWLEPRRWAVPRPGDELVEISSSGQTRRWLVLAKAAGAAAPIPGDCVTPRCPQGS